MEGEGAAQRVNGDMRPTLRCLFHGLTDLKRRQTSSIDCELGSLFLCLLKLAVIDIYGDHQRVTRTGDLHCRQSNTTTAMNCHPLARSRPALRLNSAMRRHVSTSQGRSRNRGYLVRKLDAVEISRGHRNVFCPATIAHNPCYNPVVAQVLETCAAVRAGAVGFMKGSGHTVADLYTAHLVPYLNHNATDFMSGVRGQSQIEAEPCHVLVPEVPVATANAACLNLDDGPVWTGTLDRHLDDVHAPPGRRSFAQSAYGLCRQ